MNELSFSVDFLRMLAVHTPIQLPYESANIPQKATSRLCAWGCLLSRVSGEHGSLIRMVEPRAGFKGLTDALLIKRNAQLGMDAPVQFATAHSESRQ